ncbi:isoleucine--tRNA ligase [Solitalea canadensis]|uniref:Isoleucine--tRNA ligase n=1 Tax=Solitalea canadensis (strain ATCC 29591 / DSM 3403 / JCM 21819 / LMG 8368 / NBRC 15130 / NCIMB 12057 / USAM 9D) TaxID=929556 RepID=H8KWZ1_SOLCM|nr:isoleucine--tRNA ligase [Solitalea canadensis]AFD08320.1 isoleucyl-tRNA synthetase [Solitalea canadensis DSM 3403]
MKYREYKQLDLSGIGNEVLSFWKEHKIFEKSVSSRPASKPYNFYEGPPSANGMPGIHHVMARAIKDIFCRYKTLKGYQVKRKAGWDTHGLPIELAVEKALGITKEDIGKKISVDDYNHACRKEVMRYTDVWNDLTVKMGYWVDIEHPYITYENNYIETLWFLLSELYKKGLLYKGYTIQPFSPAAGTGLSSHELNQPGTYKMVKDTTIVAQFKVPQQGMEKLQQFADAKLSEESFFLAWTTTPWTLPSNTALAVGKNIEYLIINTYNQYTFKSITVVMAKDLFRKFFSEKNEDLPLDGYKEGDKVIPYKVIGTAKGSDLDGIRYEQLLPYEQPADGDAFRVIVGDFVTTEDGTGIVHIAPSFGADDFRVAKQNGIGSLTLVDKQGRFIDSVGEFAGSYVKEEYYSDAERSAEDFKPTDVLIAIKLKEENRAFKVEKYEHSYPHCWRTDKPVLYYPLDSWFIKTTALKDRMVELNKTINWKPESTGTGRFGNWLENLVDWNLSRSRYWGTPLPIWRSLDETEEVCIGAVAELQKYLEEAVASGLLSAEETKANITYLEKIQVNGHDLHRPYVDDIVFVKNGKNLYRESDLIDVWFDSGAMPYAQWHYPFENNEDFKNAYPADFIAEGVDQTRGWFFTLHAIAVMLFDSVAFKNVVSNGLVLDKNGNKMSKRLGNAVDPFETINKYSADATRWYMISNASPWDNLKFNIEGLDEVRRKFFGTLYNTYSFFTLYANIDGFKYSDAEVPLEDRPEIDRWIISLLNSLIKEVDECYADYEPTKAARAIQNFVDEHLSNWYVRLCRRRFWKGEYSQDKVSAYQTLYRCLETIAQLMSPVAPFYSDRLFTDLNAVTGRHKSESVHLTDFPAVNESEIDKELEERMAMAQDISSMVLSLRKKVDIKVRQPLNKILLPVLDNEFQAKVEKVKDLILSETNIKEIQYINDTAGILVKKIRPNFKALGPKVGKMMKEVSNAANNFTQEDITAIERDGFFNLHLNGEVFKLELVDVEILSEDIPGWLVTSIGKLTVALDVTITEELKQEGIARELINRIQNLRKDKGFEVTDKIAVTLQSHELVDTAVKNFLPYISAEILGTNFDLTEADFSSTDNIEIDDISLKIEIERI